MWCFYDRTSIADSWEKVVSSGGIDYFVRKQGRSWYTYSVVWVDGTPYSSTMAGFSTRKAARKAAVSWSENGHTVAGIFAQAALSDSCFFGGKRAKFVDGNPVITD